MTIGDLKEDFANFEKNYYLSNLSETNFYALLDNAHICNFIEKNIKETKLFESSLDKIFMRNIQDLVSLIDAEKINFKCFKVFKSEIEIFYAYMLLFLIKTFSFKLKNSKIQKNEPEFLKMRDFFLDRNDFINIFLDYIFKFFLFNEIIHGKIFTYNKNSLRVFLFRFVAFWEKTGLIASKDLKIFNRRYKLLTFNPFQVPFIPEISLYSKKFKVYVRSSVDPYIYNDHFSSVVFITKQATYSNSAFKIQLDQVDALTERSFYIDRNLLLKNYNLLIESQPFLKSHSLQGLSELLDSYSLKIQNFLNEKDLQSLKIYHSKLSEILTLIRIKTTLDMDFDHKELFLPFMFCFRGRVYELSDLSFTFYKEFRYCAYSGVYEEELETFHPINKQINSTIDDQFHLFKNYLWFEGLSLTRKRACIWLFVALGITKKTELGKKVHISTFLLKGFELWEEKNKKRVFTDVYENIEFSYILFLIEEIKSSKILKKWIFWKDATASCFQHLLLILGERDFKSYAICNLNSTEYWYDPYAYLISDFFEKKVLIDSNKIEKNPFSLDSRFTSIFSRKRLKKVMMTESYGAGFKKLSSYFFLDLNLNKFSEIEKIFILKTWEEFFDYLLDENVLFAQSSKAINNSFTEKNLLKIINPDNTEVDYSCFIIRINQGELYIDKKRHTYQTRAISNVIDKNQFNTSLRANFVHTRDGVLARKYIVYTKMWTVHDCFSIDFLNITYMVAVINELMNGEFYDLKINLKAKKPIYSIFIIL